MAAALAPGSAAQGLHTWARVVDARDRLDVAGTRYESLPEAPYHGPLEVETGGTWRAHGADAPANQPRDRATSDGGCSRNGGAGGRAQRPMPRVAAKPSARLGSRKGPLTTDPPIRRHQRVAATYAATIASSGGGRRTATSSSSSAAAMTPAREETPPEEGEQKRQRGDAREEASGVHDDVRGASERGDAARVEGGGKGDMPAGLRPGPAIHSIVFDLDQTLFVAAPFQPSCDATGVATWASHTAGASLWSGVSRSGGGGGGSKQQRGGSRRRSADRRSYSGGLEVHDIMLSSGDSWRVVLRPGALKLLQEVRQHYKEVVAFTAAEEGYARAVLSVLDPEGRLFDRLHTRKDCSMVDLRRCGRGRTGGCGGGGGGGGGARSQALLKPVLLRHGYHPARTLVLDDNIYSFACNVENGLLLKPFRGDPRDRELEELRPQLVQVARCPDVRRALHRMRVQRLQSRLSCLQKRNPQLSSCTAFQRASFSSAARGGAVLQAFNGELALYELYQSTVPFLAL